MTEAEWLACTDPGPMLDFVQQKASDRKLRLFAAACCRQIWHLLLDERSQEAIEFAERYGGRRADEIERWVYRDNAIEATNEIAERYLQLNGGELFASSTDPLLREARMYHTAANAALWVVSDAAPDAARIGSMRAAEAYQLEFPDHAGNPNQFAEARQTQAMLFRDIFGNPFRPVEFAPAWRTSTVVTLASQMYETRDFGAMPILADALQDAGCDNEEVLTHCRGPGPHVRGCWVVDLVLGKE